MTKSKTLLTVLTLSLASAASALASTHSGGTWLIDLNHGSGNVEFDATGHPSALKIVGKGSAPTGSFTVKNGQVKGSVAFDLNSLDTGISMRTKHMKEKYLETGKYPHAQLTITRIDLPPGTQLSQLHASALPFSGTLQLHGVSKPVTGTAKLDSEGSKLTLAANFGLRVSDYGIAIPNFAGITMTDQVSISVTDSAPMTFEATPMQPVRVKRRGSSSGSRHSAH